MLTRRKTGPIFLRDRKNVKKWGLSLFLIILVAGTAIGLYFNKQRQIYIPSKALETMPESAKGHYVKGKEYYYKKDFDKAISEYKKSIKIKPTAQAYCELAVSYMEKEDFKTAIENLQASIELDSRYPKSEYAIAVCYTRINPPDLKLAREHLEKAKKLGYRVPEWFKRHLSELEGE